MELSTLSHVGTLVPILMLAALAFRIVHTQFFHPLSVYPGPWYLSSFSISLALVSLTKREPEYLMYLISKYGCKPLTSPQKHPELILPSRQTHPHLPHHAPLPQSVLLKRHLPLANLQSQNQSLRLRRPRPSTPVLHPRRRRAPHPTESAGQRALDYRPAEEHLGTAVRRADPAVRAENARAC